MELYVFDINLNLIGIIDDFKECGIDLNYDKMSQMTLKVDGDSNNINLLQKGRIVAKTDDLEHGYLILYREYVDEKSSELSITAPSINILLARRVVLGQQRYRGNIENVVKSFVTNNAISPSNSKRIIPNLTLGENVGIDINTTAANTGNQLDEYLYTLCNKHDISWDILLDVVNKKFVFTTWQGEDRSTEQSINPHVIFSKDRENILKQNYLESDLDYKSTVIVAGEGEGAKRKIITVNDEYSGLDRYELYVDARDLQTTSTNDNGEEVTITDKEYEILLQERGLEKLPEYQKIVTFESEVDLYSNYVYGQDYFVGDKVSVINDDLGIILHTRIISASETYTKEGISVDINFGSNIPNLVDKIKRAVK